MLSKGIGVIAVVRKATSDEARTGSLPPSLPDLAIDDGQQHRL
jgi:hypothetical protein